MLNAYQQMFDNCPRLMPYYCHTFYSLFIKRSKRDIFSEIRRRKNASRLIDAPDDIRVSHTVISNLYDVLFIRISS